MKSAPNHRRSRAHPRKTIAVAAVMLVPLLAGGAGCADQDATKGATMPAQHSTPDPNDPPVPLPDHGGDRDAARAKVRAMLIEQATPLLERSGFLLGDTVFYMEVPSGGRTSGLLSLGDYHVPETRWKQNEESVAAAAHALGWTQAGIAPGGINLRKGPFFLRGGCNIADGCVYEIVTSPTKQAVQGYPNAERELPELHRFYHPHLRPRQQFAT